MDDSNKVCEEVIRLLRLQRHDFLNHLQLIYAMIQLGKSEQALKYIQEVAQNDHLVSATLEQYNRNHCKTHAKT